VHLAEAIEARYRIVAEHVAKQHENRETWGKEDTLSHIEKLIWLEYDEHLEAIAHDLPAVAVASEVGDVLYLITLYESKAPLSPALTALKQEMYQFCEEVGLDPLECVEMKVLRNAIKYPDALCNNGYAYKEAMQISKLFYVALAGSQDLKFYEAYLEVFG
jgi:hypothetical protein